MLDWSDFSRIHFVDSTIEPPQVVGKDILVKVRDLSVIPNPTEPPPVVISSCTIKFINVGKSVRQFTPYAVDQFTDEFLAPVEIVDCRQNIENKKAFQKKYKFEGLLTDPVAWIDNWTVECERIEILDAEKG